MAATDCGDVNDELDDYWHEVAKAWFFVASAVFETYQKEDEQ